VSLLEHDGAQRDEQVARARAWLLVEALRFRQPLPCVRAVEVRLLREPERAAHGLPRRDGDVDGGPEVSGARGVGAACAKVDAMPARATVRLDEPSRLVAKTLATKLNISPSDANRTTKAGGQGIPLCEGDPPTSCAAGPA
jgi:hypothetical protein